MTLPNLKDVEGFLLMKTYGLITTTSHVEDESLHILLKRMIRRFNNAPIRVSKSTPT